MLKVIIWLMIQSTKADNCETVYLNRVSVLGLHLVHLPSGKIEASSSLKRVVQCQVLYI